MSYASIADLQSRLGHEILSLLADDTGDLEAEDGILEAALDDASARIDSALGGRYGVPLESVPPLLTRLCIDLAVEGLFLRRRQATPPEFTARAGDARELLAEIARGGAILPGVAPADSAKAESTMRGEPRHFDREALESY